MPVQAPPVWLSWQGCEISVDIYFSDASEIPLPPEEVRIRGFDVYPWQDKRRVQILLEITPFQKRPNGEINVTNAMGEEVANISIIEMIDPKIEFTVHLRGAGLVGPFTASAWIYYSDESVQPINEQESGSEESKKLIVDHASTSFTLD